jgi:hypothetical protein
MVAKKKQKTVNIDRFCCARGCKKEFTSPAGTFFCPRHQAIALEHHPDLVESLRAEADEVGVQNKGLHFKIIKLQTIIANNDEHVLDQIEMFADT